MRTYLLVIALVLLLPCESQANSGISTWSKYDKELYFIMLAQIRTRRDDVCSSTKDDWITECKARYDDLAALLYFTFEAIKEQSNSYYDKAEKIQEEIDENFAYIGNHMSSLPKEFPPKGTLND